MPRSKCALKYSAISSFCIRFMLSRSARNARREAISLEYDPAKVFQSIRMPASPCAVTPGGVGLDRERQ